MLNKILSKKIKSPLSLRAKQRSNLSGFSLIELMVAIAILAIAIFGIFHAYSVGFMGMADARDRTVATNYAREAMEDVKNKDFEKIVTTTKSVITSNIKYRVDVNVSSESNNLKKVYTVVNWKDKNGIGKKVETTMLVHFIEVYASEAAKIVLFADSYTILNTGAEGGTFTELTAVIKDIKGNTIIDWGERSGEGDIIFSEISGDHLGSLSDTSVTPINGIAKTTFSSSGLLTEEIEYAVIGASVTLPNSSNVSDTVTIKVTDGPVKIILSADPDIIKASTENNSTITVSLGNAANQILKKSELVTDVEITFSVFGEGNLSTYTITIPAISEEPASDEIILNSTGTPGVASLVATATDLESDTVDVRFLGPPVSISISANPNPIYEDDEGSTITVSLLDVNGFSTNPTEIEGTIIVELDLSPANGSLNPSFLTFNADDFEGIPEIAYFGGVFSVGAVTITASGGGLTADSVLINIFSALVPDHIELTASPQSVVASGSSTITATIYDGGRIVKNYNGNITFRTTLGVFSNSSDTIIEEVVNGKATTVLTSSLISPGNAIITITNPDPTVLPFNPSDGLVVEFYGGADHIELTASPQSVMAGGSSTITATVYDSNYIHVSNYSGTIIFTIVFEGISYDSSVDTTNGKAFTVLSFYDAGTATVTAVDFSNVLTEDSVEVIFYTETTIKLIDGSAKYYPADLEVVFEVIVAGEDILVDEMKIFWEDSSAEERFHKIVINNEDVYTGGNDKSGTIVDIEDKTLSAGESYIVKLTFEKDMTEKDFMVIFYPYTEMYEVTFSPITQ